MRRLARSAAALAALFLLFALGARGADTRTLNGEYVWSQGSRGALEAVFTPTGEGTWDVEFHFKFQGKPHTYTGTAEGSLGSGTLRGDVTNEDKRRTFKFQGSFEDGRFKGTHEETTSGRAGKTGTMTLS